MNDMIQTLKYLEERAENIKRYSDGLRDNLIEFQQEIDKMAHVGVTAESAVFYESMTKTYHYPIEWSWYFDGDGLWIKKTVEFEDDTELLAMREAPRKVLVEGIKFIVEFLDTLLEAFEKKEQEIGEAFEASQKIQKILSELVPEDVD